MSLAELAARAEVLKLADLLGTDPAGLDYLAGAPPEDLAALREQVTDVLFDGDRPTLKRLADAAAFLPVALLATMAEKAIGPLLCGRLTGMIDTDRAIAVAARLPTEFLAQVATETDPRRAATIIAGLPGEQVSDVGAVLVDRGEYVAMGRFAGYVSDEALAASIATIGDADLIRVAFVLEGKDRLDALIALLPDERLAEVVLVADEQELWPEALDLLAHLGPEQLDRVARLAGPGAFAEAERQATARGIELTIQ